jgi:TPR repeat protein
MSVFDPRPTPRLSPPLWGFLLITVAALFIGFVAARWDEGGLSMFRPTSNDTLQQAQLELRNGYDRAAEQGFAELAQKGNPDAQYWVGYLTELGVGTKRDPQKAIASLKQAADHNIVAAQLQLGEIYMRGDLVPPDSSLAKDYLQRAAYQGDHQAARLLGHMYRAGIGQSPDFVDAYAWSEVATIEGDPLAKADRDASLQQLDANDQRAAVARAKSILAGIKPQTQPPAQNHLSA